MSMVHNSKISQYLDAWPRIPMPTLMLLWGRIISGAIFVQLLKIQGVRAAVVVGHADIIT